MSIIGEIYEDQLEKKRNELYECNLVICNQAKALEGMRERLRSHGRKLTERQHKITQQAAMIALRDEKIAGLETSRSYIFRCLKELQEQCRNQN